MAGIGSSLSKPEDGTALINPSVLNQLSGIEKYMSRSAFDAAVAQERANITNNGTGIWSTNERLVIYGESGVRVWFVGSSAANSHARNVSYQGKTYSLAADANTFGATTGAPASGVGAVGDMMADALANLVYQKAAAGWFATDRVVQSPRTFIRPVGRSVVRADAGVATLTQAQQSVSPAIYYPSVIYVRDKLGASALADYYIYFSSDHAPTQATCGVTMGYGPSPTGPWTGFTKVFADAQIFGGTNGQTETPAVVWDWKNNQFVMFYQQAGAVYTTTINGNNHANSTQTTLRATSPDGAAWTKDAGFAIDTYYGGNQQPGVLHTGYFLPFEIGGSRYAYHLMSAATYPTFSLSVCRSEDWRDWCLVPKALPRSHPLLDALNPLLRIEWNASTVVRRKDGSLLWLGMVAVPASGTAARTTVYCCVAAIADDLVTLLEEPQIIWGNALLSWENANVRSMTFMTKDDAVFVYIVQEPTANDHTTQVCSVIKHFL